MYDYWPGHSEAVCAVQWASGTSLFGLFGAMPSSTPARSAEIIMLGVSVREAVEEPGEVNEKKKIIRG
jgi:hypothetical protein